LPAGIQNSVVIQSKKVFLIVTGQEMSVFQTLLGTRQHLLLFATLRVLQDYDRDEAKIDLD
jgi:hypothetical protein